MAHGFLTVHGVLSHECMNVYVHKAGQEQVALEIDGLRALYGEPLPDGGDAPIADHNVRTLLESAVDKGFCVFNEHWYLPFSWAASPY